MTAKLFYKVGFFSQLAILVSGAAVLTYDLGFNDAKLTTKSIAKAQALANKFKDKAEESDLVKNILENVNDDSTADPLERVSNILGVTEATDSKAESVSFQTLTDEPLVSESAANQFGFENTPNDPAEATRLTNSFKQAWSLRKEFKVTSVADGDTVRGYYVSDSEKTSQSIRITSIDTPESTSLTKPNVWQKTWGKRAAAFAKENLLDIDSTRTIYILETPDTSHGRVVGSVWYADVPASGHIEITSYAHDVVRAGLAIPARLKTQGYYSLDEGDGNNSGAGDFEKYFEQQLGEKLIEAAQNGRGFWSVSRTEDTTKSTSVKDDGEDYSTIESWYDIFDNDFDYLDITSIPTDLTTAENIKRMATIIEYYVYPAITWWKSDDLNKRKTGNYCTLDTILKTALSAGESGSVCPNLTT